MKARKEIEQEHGDLMPIKKTVEVTQNEHIIEILLDIRDLLLEVIDKPKN
jgi:hypothetical protein